MKTRQIHGLGLGEFLIFAPAKEMLKSAYFFSALTVRLPEFFVALRFAFLVVSEGNRTVVLCLSVAIGVSVAEIDGL